MPGSDPRPSTPPRPRTVSLVLGSGGARGLAHVGVIRWLEANGLRIVSIAGTSIGALVGGIHAAGKLDAFEQWARTITVPTMLSLMDLSWGRGGLVKGDRFIGTLTAIVGERDIESLPIAFTAVAAQLDGGKEIWLRSGPLLSAIRASISLPLLFAPYEYRGMKLIDGGVLNPVPIAPTLGDLSDLTIAVNLGGPVHEDPPTDARMPAVVAGPPSPGYAGFIDRITEFVRGGGEAPRAGSGSTDWSAYDVAYLAFDAMQGTIARQKLAAYPPDRLVEISRSACRTLEFDRASEMIDLGFRQAAIALGDLVGGPAAPPAVDGAAGASADGAVVTGPG